MKTNVGGLDQFVRIVLGVVILALGVGFGSWWGLIGLIPLLTGLFRWCPVYKMMHRGEARPPRGAHG